MTYRGQRRWSPEDGDMLRKLARAGESVVNISQKLNRGPNSIRARAKKLNIELAKSRPLKNLPRK